MIASNVIAGYSVEESIRKGSENHIKIYLTGDIYTLFNASVDFLRISLYTNLGTYQRGNLR